MVTSNWFLAATDARNNVVKLISVNGEISSIEQAVLKAVQRGDLEVTINDGTLVTQSTSSASLAFSVDPSTNIITVPDHNFSTGDVVLVSSTGELPPPLISNVFYYVIYIDKDRIKLAASRANAVAGQSISINITQGVTSVTVTEPGSGYVTAPVVTFLGGDAQMLATAQARLFSHGSLSSVVPITDGTTYSVTPSVSVIPPGSGASVDQVFFKVVSITSISFGGSNYNVGDLLFLITGAGSPAAVAQVTSVNGGTVTSATLLTAGSYPSTVLPDLAGSVTSTDGAGAGCSINLSMGIDRITISDGGTGYPTPPLVSIDGGGGVGASARAQLVGGSVNVINIINAGSGYDATPSVTISSGENATAVAVLNPTSLSSILLLDNGDATYTEPPAVSITTQGAGATAGIVRLKTVQAFLRNAGSGYVKGDTLLASGGVATTGTNIQVTEVNLAGAIISFNIVEGGAYLSVPTLFSNPMFGGSGNDASFDLVMGVASIDVNNAGSNYAIPPLVLIQGGGGSNSQAQSELTAGAVSSITVTNPGSGYQFPPTVTVTNGDGATAVASLVPTTVDSINIVDGGSGYVTPPVVTIDGGGGSGATAEAVLTGDVVSQINIINAGSGYTSSPNVIIDGNAQAQASLVPTPVASIQLVTAGENYSSTPFVTVDGAAAALALLTPTLINSVRVINAGENYTADPLIQIVPSVFDTLDPQSPLLRTQRSFSVEQIVLTNSGVNYESVPNVLISAPQLSGVTATATATLGTGSGMFTIKAYSASMDYWKVKCGISPSSELLTRPYRDYLNAITKYFTDLGYSVVLDTNPITGNTLRWIIKW
jgi:hypothetical protein